MLLEISLEVPVLVPVLVVLSLVSLVSLISLVSWVSLDPMLSLLMTDCFISSLVGRLGSRAGSPLDLRESSEPY